MGNLRTRPSCHGTTYFNYSVATPGFPGFVSAGATYPPVLECLEPCPAGRDSQLAMAYQAHIDVRNGYLRVAVSGRRRLGDAATDASEVGMQVVRACREHSTYRVLLVLDLTGRLSAFDFYEMVSNARDYGWTHAFRLAIVDNNPRSMVDSEFTETIAVNRAYAVKVFRNEDEALQWLLAGPD